MPIKWYLIEKLTVWVDDIIWINWTLNLFITLILLLHNKNRELHVWVYVCNVDLLNLKSSYMILMELLSTHTYSDWRSY